MTPKMMLISTIILWILFSSACAPNLDKIEPISESFPTEKAMESNDVLPEEDPPAETELPPIEPTSESFPTEQVMDSNDALPEEDPPVETELPPGESLLHPPATRTGIESLDKVVEAVLSNRVDDRKALVHYTKLACSTEDGLGGPPKCKPGEAEGTLLEVLPILESEGHHARRDSIDQTLSFNVEALYAIYHVPEETWQDESFPAGNYGLVVILSDYPFPLTVHVKDGSIVRLEFNIGKNPAEVIEQRGGELVLPSPSPE